MNSIKPKYFQTDRSVKSIDIEGKIWFDRVNGNSYNSSVVTINYGLKNEFSFSIPFTYGYGDYYAQKAREVLVELGITSSKWANELINKGIEYNAYKQDGCLKRDVVSHGLSCEKIYK